MRIAIVEDETAAASNLKTMLHEVLPDAEIAAELESVAECVEYFGNADNRVDIVFMDIHLADGESFRIFDSADIEAPIIFTTAYDQYALEAFRVNSIDYLLKPIQSSDLRRAVDKFRRLSNFDRSVYRERVEEFANRHKDERQAFLIHVRDKIIPLKRDEIAFFHTSNEMVSAYTHTGMVYPMDKTLEALQTLLPQSDFFRANRQFIISRRAVSDISVWFGSRLSINLNVESPEKIIVSKARVPVFKEWLTSVQPD